MNPSIRRPGAKSPAGTLRDIPCRVDPSSCEKVSRPGRRGPWALPQSDSAAAPVSEPPDSIEGVLS